MSFSWIIAHIIHCHLLLGPSFTHWKLVQWHYLHVILIMAIYYYPLILCSFQYSFSTFSSCLDFTFCVCVFCQVSFLILYTIVMILSSNCDDYFIILHKCYSHGLLYTSIIVIFWWVHLSLIGNWSNGIIHMSFLFHLFNDITKKWGYVLFSRFILYIFYMT